MTVSIADIRHAIEIMLIEIYPDISALGEGCYSLNDILDQLIFELIKEEYKKYAARRPIQYYLDLYDSEHYNCGCDSLFIATFMYRIRRTKTHGKAKI